MLYNFCCNRGSYYSLTFHKRVRARVRQDPTSTTTLGYFSMLQVKMLRAKFSTIKIRSYLLQRCDTNFGHFNNKFCHKVNKTSYDFSQEIADCCSIRLATLLQKNCKYLFKFDLNFLQKVSIRKFGIVNKGIDSNAQGPGIESSQR